MFRHGLRVSEVCRMRLDQMDTESRVLHVSKLKHRLTAPLLKSTLFVCKAQANDRHPEMI
jgi:type 1 fimbriae regulatory protein FimB